MMRHRWQSRDAVSDTMGAATGITAIIFLIVGLLGVGQILSAHSALSQAANAAVNSEAQNGCWVPATTAVTRNTLQGDGINPATVTVTNHTSGETAWPTSAQPYSTPLGVQLSLVVHPLSFLNVPLTVQTQAVVQTTNTSQVTCTSPIQSPLSGGTSPTGSTATDKGDVAPTILCTTTAIPNDTTTLYGDNFGSTTGYVIFTDAGASWGSAQNTQMTVNAWEPNSAPPTCSVPSGSANPNGLITFTVPPEAAPGPASVQVVLPSGVESIPYALTVSSS